MASFLKTTAMRICEWLCILIILNKIVNNITICLFVWYVLSERPLSLFWLNSTVESWDDDFYSTLHELLASFLMYDVLDQFFQDFSQVLNC